MIKTDLIISETGAVVLVQNEPFGREITRVEFYLENKYLILVDHAEDTHLIECEITDADAITALTQNATIILTYIHEGAPQDGFEVPLITVRP